MPKRLKYNFGEQREESVEKQGALRLVQICLRLFELVSGSVMVPQPCKQLRAGIATRTSLTLADMCCACPRGAPRWDFENQHSKNTGVSSWGCGRVQKVLSPFRLASAFQYVLLSFSASLILSSRCRWCFQGRPLTGNIIPPPTVLCFLGRERPLTSLRCTRTSCSAGAERPHVCEHHQLPNPCTGVWRGSFLISVHSRTAFIFFY